FHAPTMSFPVAGTLMIEPTESEDQALLRHRRVERGGSAPNGPGPCGGPAAASAARPGLVPVPVWNSGPWVRQAWRARPSPAGCPSARSAPLGRPVPPCVSAPCS
ncbi:hypothetical protein, partial [Streptomyces sp. NPDC048845]|uniref:hypothetical protein n=1 Tax=Streptomyces sp. NPDC048845 TaxID=3155390 RepID=UPI003424D661